ncbi:hypothetical protein J2X69_003142 [Algoriphagus sp. 4150]|uniref:hypothetical protein n=1 Tax=Algoriphagus sp. 4150 TaxID=2817756 RepID=UPI002865318F|nr:hypothetical protein [Algoriphagus sp. 4150]MDR7130785.1 hypothetical protein [Algoriphagus sp. 4150]
MKNYSTVFLYLILACLFLACAENTDAEDPVLQEDFASRMEGEAYLGSAKSTLFLHGYEKLPSVDGEGSFSLAEVAGDSVTLALVVELTTGDGFTLGIPGIQIGSAWKASLAGGEFAIRDNGEMSGSVITTTQEISWDGHLFADKIFLDVRSKYLIQEDNITEGSIFLTHLELYRSSTQGGSSGNDCKNIVWQNRAVFNIHSGGVDMMSVPVCTD